MENLLVSIIIVNYNGRKYLNECLSSLFGQTYKNLEVILVDNNSSDDSLPFVRATFPAVIIIEGSSNLGFAAGTNVGIKASKGDLICLFNQDAIADKDWLSTLVNAIQSSGDVAAVAGKVYYWGDKYGKNAVFCTWSKIDPYTAGPYNFYKGDEPLSKVDYLTGAAMLVKKEVIEKIGLLDQEYFLYFEETEWCARMIRLSYDLLYIPQAIVWHVVSGSISDSKFKSYYINRSRIRFALKNFDATYIPIFLIFIFLENIFTFINDIRNRDLSETRTRMRAVGWNILNIFKTLKARRTDMDTLSKSGRRMCSYNKSLPLQEFKIGRLEQYLSFVGK